MFLLSRGLRIQGRGSIYVRANLACVLVCACIFASGPTHATARGVSDGVDPSTPATETWFGGEALAGSWSVYAGTTTAWGGGLDRDGWRLRSVAGYGEFRYERGEAGTAGFREHEARSLFADVMPGGQFTLGPTTVKLFAGATFIDRNIVPSDPDDIGKLSRLGVKAALETWTNLPNGFALKLDLSAAHLFDNAIDFQQFRATVGVSTVVADGIRLGLETSAATDRNYRAFQFGPTAEFTLARDIVLGVGAGYIQARDDDGAYGRVQLRLKY